MFAGITDHLTTNASPRLSSRPKTRKFATMILTVTIGKCTGRRDASVNGIRPAILSSTIRICTVGQSPAGGQLTRDGARGHGNCEARGAIEQHADPTSLFGFYTTSPLKHSRIVRFSR